MTDVPSHTTTQAALHPKRWKAMPIIALAVSIIIMDATVVNVVLPVLIRDINLTASDAEWINSVYALVFASLLITVGRIGDIFGRRRLLIIGILIFGVASVLAAMSYSGTTLIAARLLQGVGGAMILPATLSTSTRSSPDASGASPSRSGAPPSAVWRPSGPWSADG